MGNGKFSKDVDRSAREIMKTRKEKQGFWRYASAIGVGGWIFVIPVVAGAYLGRYLDRNLAIGISWTITLIIIGLMVGGYNVWYVFFREKENEQDRDIS